MKKAEIIAMQNRLEYLKDKVDRLSGENRKFKAGLDELQTASETLLKKVTIEKGTDVNGAKELWLPRYMDLDDYDVDTKLDEAGERIGIIMRKKEAQHD